MHRHGRSEIFGTAYSDHDLAVFLEGAGIAESEAVLDQPKWREWREDFGDYRGIGTPPRMRGCSVG